MLTISNNNAINKSIDGGETWNKIHTGFPEGDLGRIGLAIAPNKTNIIYALVESKKNALYKYLTLRSLIVLI